MQWRTDWAGPQLDVYFSAEETVSDLLYCIVGAGNINSRYYRHVLIYDDEPLTFNGPSLASALNSYSRSNQGPGVTAKKTLKLICRTLSQHACVCERSVSHCIPGKWRLECHTLGPPAGGERWGERKRGEAKAAGGRKGAGQKKTRRVKAC